MEKKKDLNDGLMQAKGGRCGERSKEGGGGGKSQETRTATQHKLENI